MRAGFSLLCVVLCFAFGLAASSASADGPVSTATGTAAAKNIATPAEKQTDAQRSNDKRSDGKQIDAERNDAKPKDSAKTNGTKNLRPLAGFTPEREAAALTFVRANHPELAELLDRLKARRPHDYERAIRDLFRVSERLALSRETFPVRYELELQEWKLTSRIQVVGARLSMGRTPEQEQELKQLLAEQLDVHRRLVAFNLERTKNRTATLQRELDDIEARREAILDAKFDKAIKAADQRKPAKAAANAEKKDPENNDAVKKSDAKSDN